jgi:hypothetical protein
LLEAGLKGIPAVIAPAQCPPPYGSDGVGLDGTLERPGTLEEYESKVVQLCRSRDQREREGRKLRGSIARHHTADGWRKYLEAALAQLPREHAPMESVVPIPVDPELYGYWCRVLANTGSGYSDTLETAILRAMRIGLRPSLTADVRRVCARARSVRGRGTIPVPVLAGLCNVLLPILPLSWAGAIFRGTAFVFRGSLLRRAYARLSGLVRGPATRRTGYDVYRVREHSDQLSGQDATIIRRRITQARALVS